MNFNLDDLSFNKSFTQKLMKKITETIEDNSDYKVYRTGDGNEGWIFLYNIIRKTSDYVVQYKVRKWNWLEKTVTQCIIWRDNTSNLANDITTRILFGYLLQNYPAIMSDRLQTKNGNDFWMRQMARAISRNYRVGIANCNRHDVDWYDSAQDGLFQDWIKSQDTFGIRRYPDDLDYQALRYVIAN